MDDEIFEVEDVFLPATTEERTNPLQDTHFKDAYIYQANPLIEACKNMDITEGRLFYLSLMNLHPQLSNLEEAPTRFEKIFIPAATVIKIFGNNKAYYKKLKPIAEKLMARKIGLKNDKDDYDLEHFKWINIFSSMEWRSKEGLYVEFNISMLDYLLLLADKPYTKITGKTIFSLHSVYGVRLLELMLQYQNIENFKASGIIKRKLSLEELRVYMNVPPGSYKAIKDFKVNVIDAAVNNINDRTKHHVSYESIKVGRAIKGFEFEMKIVDDKDIENIDDIIEYREEIKERELLNLTDATGMKELLLRYGVGKIVAGRLAQNYPAETIEKNIEYALKRKSKIKNLGAYIVKAIKEDFDGQAVLQEETEREIEKSRKAAEKVKYQELVARINETEQRKREEAYNSESIEDLQSTIALLRELINVSSSEENKAMYREKIEEYEKKIKLLKDPQFYEHESMDSLF